jgi:hypothetical protein
VINPYEQQSSSQHSTPQQLQPNSEHPSHHSSVVVEDPNAGQQPGTTSGEYYYSVDDQGISQHSSDFAEDHDANSIQLGPNQPPPAVNNANQPAANINQTAGHRPQSASESIEFVDNYIPVNQQSYSSSQLNIDIPPPPIQPPSQESSGRDNMMFTSDEDDEGGQSFNTLSTSSIDKNSHSISSDETLDGIFDYVRKNPPVSPPTKKPVYNAVGNTPVNNVFDFNTSLVVDPNANAAIPADQTVVPPPPPPHGSHAGFFEPDDVSPNGSIVVDNFAAETGATHLPKITPQIPPQVTQFSTPTPSSSDKKPRLKIIDADPLMKQTLPELAPKKSSIHTAPIFPPSGIKSPTSTQQIDPLLRKTGTMPHSSSSSFDIVSPPPAATAKVPPIPLPNIQATQPISASVKKVHTLPISVPPTVAPSPKSTLTSTGILKKSGTIPLQSTTQMPPLVTTRNTKKQIISDSFPSENSQDQDASFMAPPSLSSRKPQVAKPTTKQTIGPTPQLFKKPINPFAQSSSSDNATSSSSKKVATQPLIKSTVKLPTIDSFPTDEDEEPNASNETKKKDKK